MTVVKELFTRMGFKVDFAAMTQFDSRLKATNTALNQLKQSIGQQLKLQIDASSATSASSKLKSLASDLKGFAAAYLGVQGVMSAGRFIFDAGVQFEKLSASLETVEGSAQKANAAFKKIEAFAAKTPYDLNQVTEAYIKLKALGLDPSERALSSYGNTASAMGKSLMQMIEAVADASTGEFERLKEFGIKASKEGDKVKFTFRGVTTTVKNSSKEIQEYLLRIGEVQFAGGMERQAKTIGGKLSTLADNFGALARAIWNGGLKDAAHSFVGWLDGLTKQLGPLAKDLGASIPGALRNMGNLLTIAAGAVGLFTLRMIGMKAIMAGVWIFNAVRAFQTLTWTAIAAKVAVFAIPIAIGAVVAAVAYLGYQIYTFATTGKGWIGELAKKFPEFGEMANQARELFMQWMPSITEIIEVLKILIMDGIVALGRITIDIIQNWIIPAIMTLGAMWQQFWEGFEIIKQMILMAYEDWQRGIEVVGDYWRAWGQNVANTVNWVYEIFTGFFNYLSEKFSWVTNAASSVANAMSSIGGALGFGGGGGGGDVSTGGGGGGGIAAAAKAFVSSGQADIFAKTNNTLDADGRRVFAKGVACALTVREVAKRAGVKPEVLAKMSLSAPGTYNALIASGYAVQVSEKDRRPGDIIYATNGRYGGGAGGIYHTGILSEQNKVIDAENGRGHEIGQGQRIVEANNWMSGNAIYIRLKDSAFNTKTVNMPAASFGGGGGMSAPVNQQFQINVGGSNSSASDIAKRTGDAAKTGTVDALTSVFRNVPKRVGPR